MQRWVVILEKKAAKELKRLPKEIVLILAQFKVDLEAEGPTPKGWIVKHVQGQPGVYAARLKREYRVLYEVIAPSIIILTVAHRKEAY